MASSGSNNDPGDPADRLETPKTPTLVLREDVKSEPLQPDTEKNVSDETDGVVRFFFQELRNKQRNQQEADDTPPEMGCLAPPCSSANMSPAEQVGRQLAIIGDAVNERYASDFGKMIRMLKLEPKTAYEGFAAVARQLFSDGTINWGRIIILLCFGYRVVMTVLQCGMTGLFENVLSYVVMFVIRERIARWIAEQGGWRAALRYIPESIGWTSIGVICGVAAISLIAVLYLTKQ